MLEIRHTKTDDIELLTRQALFAGYQYFSLFTPLIYTVYAVRRRGRNCLTIDNVLRATWIGGVSGAACTGGLAYLRYAYMSERNVRAKRLANAYDAGHVLANDHATIGAVLSAVLLPAIMWRRAKIVNLILGGAGIGSAIGLLTYHFRAAKVGHKTSHKC